MQNIFELKKIFIGLQMLFVAFGALVLVPLLVGLDPNTALLTAGLGTLVFQFFTKGKVPIFLASSFSFIAPMIYGIQTWGLAATMGGMMSAGLLYFCLSVLVKLKGKGILEQIFPPIVIGPVIMIIGLSLVSVGVNMSVGKTGDGAQVLFDYNIALFISALTLLTTVLIVLFAKGIFKLIPIMFGITVGYIASLCLGIINFDAVANAPWFALPTITTPEFNWQAILYILPVAIAPAVEHVGGIFAISEISGENFVEDPGLHRTLLGDAMATATASLLGGPPNTTYAEVTGAVMLTRNFDPRIMTWAAIWAIVIAFCGKIGAFLSTIPTIVMGGIMMLVFGSIAVVGLNTLINSKINVTEPRNLCIISIVMTFGIGGMYIDIGSFKLAGIGLCAVTAIILNLILPTTKTNK